MSNENSTNNAPRLCSRVWGIILYADNPIHVAEVEKLQNDIRAVGVYHDRDITDEGEQKKAHYHFLYHFDNPSTIGSIQKLLPGHESNLFYCVKSFRGQARYLLHLDNAEKTRYDKDSLIGNVRMINKFLQTTDTLTEDTTRIVTFIESIDGYLSLSSLMYWICQEDLLSVYMKLQHTFLHMLNSHNKGNLKGDKLSDL